MCMLNKSRLIESSAGPVCATAQLRASGSREYKQGKGSLLTQWCDPT